MFQSKYALTFTLIHMLMFSYMEHHGMSMNVMFRQIFWHSKHVQLSAKGIFWPASLGEFHELSRYPLFVSHFFALPYFWPLSSLSFHLNLLQESVPTSRGSPESGSIAPELVVVSPCHRRCLKQLACRIKQHQAASNRSLHELSMRQSFCISVAILCEGFSWKRQKKTPQAISRKKMSSNNKIEGQD